MVEVARIEQIAKDYGSTKALEDVSLTLFAGEIHGLVGENGAGKSTLAKIISGDITASSGKYLLEGREFLHPTPKKAVQNGVCIVHQWGDLAPNLTVLENMFLGYEMRMGSGLLDIDSMKNKAKSVLSRFKIEIELDAPAGSLPPVQQQIAAIAKALCKDARLLVVDEGGVSLDIEELECLVSVLRNLRDEGVCILYISHLLDNVLEVSDRITALRNGRLIATVKASEVGISDLITFVVGHEMKTATASSARSTSAFSPVLNVRELSWLENGYALSFTLAGGTILGFTGPAGAGKSETFRALLGLQKKYSGDVEFEGKRLNKFNPRYLSGIGIAYVPEDRFVDGMLADRSIEENISLPGLRYNGIFLQKKNLRAHAIGVTTTLNVRMRGIESLMRELSGGNQQKVVVGKWLDDRYKLFIFDEPYKGIDIGAKEEINTVIRNLASQGKAVIVISTEFSELIGLVHRLHVMVDRKIVVSLEGEEIENKRILGHYQSVQKNLEVGR